MEPKTKGEIAVTKWCNLDEIETEAEHAGYSGYIQGYNQAIVDNVPHWKKINQPVNKIVVAKDEEGRINTGAILWSPTEVQLLRSNNTLVNCTHYILIEDLLKLPTETE